MYKIYIFLKNYLKKIIELWATFFSATVLSNLNNNLENTIKSVLDITNVANVVFFIWTIVLIILVIVYFISKSSVTKKAPNVVFLKIMEDKTADVLKTERTGQMDFSWGYNKNIHRPKIPAGWEPSNFWISNYDHTKRFEFPKNDDNGMEGYNAKEYSVFYNSEEMINCRKNKNDMDRFAVYSIIPNFNDSDKKIRIEIQRTKWSELQFHWRYMRLLDERNSPIEKSEAVKKMYSQVFLNDPEQKFLINSFCLHLILEDSKGNAIISRISSNKSNDYSGTWAATIGEQLSLVDFYNFRDNSIYSDFIQRWTRRALEEELDISKEDETVLGENELETFVDMDSLRILSIDMEGDIYNIALTAVVKLKLSIDELREQKGIQIDSEELTELESCDLKKIRKILLGYPENVKLYHPSTYLRLLMFYLYKCGIKKTCIDISKDYNSNKKQTDQK